jgi:hypothetical protein
MLYPSLCTLIKNIAYILFDCNPRIFTNTATSEFSQDESGMHNKLENFNFSIAPNPSNGEICIVRNYNSTATIKLYNVQGGMM